MTTPLTAHRRDVHNHDNDRCEDDVIAVTGVVTQTYKWPQRSANCLGPDTWRIIPSASAHYLLVRPPPGGGPMTTGHDYSTQLGLSVFDLHEAIRNCLKNGDRPVLVLMVLTFVSLAMENYLDHPCVASFECLCEELAAGTLLLSDISPDGL